MNCVATAGLELELGVGGAAAALPVAVGLELDVGGAGLSPDSLEGVAFTGVRGMTPLQKTFLPNISLPWIASIRILLMVLSRPLISTTPFA